jgi:hypothetical protein
MQVKETCTTAAARELREETGICIGTEDLQPSPVGRACMEMMRLFKQMTMRKTRCGTRYMKCIQCIWHLTISAFYMTPQPTGLQRSSPSGARTRTLAGTRADTTINHSRELL